MTRDVSTVSRVKKMGHRGIWKKGLKGGGGSGNGRWRNGEDSHNIVYTAGGHTDMGKRRDSRMTVTEGGGP